MSHLSLPDDVLADLELAAKHSLAMRTWSSYKTAERSLILYCKEEGIRFQLPVTEKVLAGFVHWLGFKRSKKAATINNYLAGIRKLHILKGLPAPTLRTDFIQMVLMGKKNMEDAARLRDGSNERQPVTTDILQLIKARLRSWEAPGRDKCTIWTICTLLFHGAFRGGELLCRSKYEFDPAFTLLRQDMVLVQDTSCKNTSMLQVKVKAPKERKDNRAVIVDVYQSDTEICPVRAYKKWYAATASNQPDQPAFRLDDGVPVTATTLNSILHERLTRYLDNQRITAHSFRGGAASMMASLGYSDKDVKAVGRWSSRAVELYIKLPRTKRLVVARKVKKFGL